MSIFEEQQILYLIMLITSLFLVIGLMIYSTPYRKRGRLSDRMFFVMELCCLIGLCGDSLMFPIVIANKYGHTSLGNTLTNIAVILDIAHTVFDGILILYVYYRKTVDPKKLKKAVIIVGAFVGFLVLYHHVLVLLLPLIAPNTVIPAEITQLMSVITKIYHYGTLLIMLIVSKRVALYYVLTLLTSTVMQWLSGWGETGSMMNAPLLVCIHLYVMNMTFNGEDENVPVRI